MKKKLAAEGQEAVSNEIVGQAHVESIALNLFNWADREDRKSNFNKYGTSFCQLDQFSISVQLWLSDFPYFSHVLSVMSKENSQIEQYTFLQ